MKKLMYVAVLGAVLLAACGGGSNTVAATVNGHDVTVGQVESLATDDEGAISKEEFAQLLGYQIQWTVLSDAAEDEYGISVTDDEVTAEADRLYEQFAAEGQSREDFLAVNGMTEDFLVNVARQGLVDGQIREIVGEDVPDPTEEELEEQLNVAKAPLTSACISHILVPSEEEAGDVYDRLDDGEEFGALALELSSDTGSAQNNGELPCGTLENWVAPFRNAALVAPVGDVYETPVESQFGWHVILVTEREDADETALPSDTELEDAVRVAAVSSEIQAWLLETITAADVTVVEAYGTWDPNGPSVVPPTE